LRHEAFSILEKLVLQALFFGAARDHLRLSAALGGEACAACVGHPNLHGPHPCRTQGLTVFLDAFGGGRRESSAWGTDDKTVIGL